jgi:hypothetical protein
MIRNGELRKKLNEIFMEVRISTSGSTEGSLKNLGTPGQDSNQKHPE